MVTFVKQHFVSNKARIENDLLTTKGQGTAEIREWSPHQWMEQYTEVTTYLKVHQVIWDVWFYTLLTHGYDYYAHWQINIGG